MVAGLIFETLMCITILIFRSPENQSLIGKIHSYPIAACLIVSYIWVFVRLTIIINSFSE